MKKTPRQFRISDDMHAAVQRVAINDDLSVSAVIRGFVREGLKRRGVWPVPSSATATIRAVDHDAAAA